MSLCLVVSAADLFSSQGVEKERPFEGVFPSPSTLLFFPFRRPKRKDSEACTTASQSLLVSPVLFSLSILPFLSNHAIELLRKLANRIVNGSQFFLAVSPRLGDSHHTSIIKINHPSKVLPSFFLSSPIIACITLHWLSLSTLLCLPCKKFNINIVHITSILSLWAFNYQFINLLYGSSLAFLVFTISNSPTW